MLVDARFPDARFRPDPASFEIRVEPRIAPGSRERPRRARRPLPWLRLSLASGAIIAGLSALAVRRLPPEPPPPLPDLAEAMPAERAVALQAPPPAWTHLAGAPSPYAVDSPLLYGLDTTTEARRHRSGGREDGLVIGSPGADEPHLRLTVSRLSREVTGAPASLFVEVARRAAEVELAVTRVGRAAALATKFGTLEAAEMGLEAGRSRSCLAFRFQHGEADLRLFGWYCGASASPATRGDLACLIDSVSLTPAADDMAIRVLFAGAERHRVCPPPEPTPVEAKPAEPKPERRRRG